MHLLTIFKRTILAALVCVLVNIPLTVTVSAQTVFLPSVQLYRFRVPGNNLGYLLTAYYSEGTNNGLIYEGPVGFIYVPALFGFPNTGTVPSNSNLNPVHRWMVIQNGRLYFYYSQYYRQLGSDYTYQGVVGYMYNSAMDVVNLQIPGGGTNTYPLYKVKSCYSQSYGYFHGKLWPFNPNVIPPVYSLENPPNGTFNCSPEHELIGGGVFTTRGTSPGASPSIPESGASFGTTKDDNEVPFEPFTVQ